MTRFGITFDGKHSYMDFGLLVVSRDIGNPNKIKVKERVPYSNQIYDFSGIYGGQEYDERRLTYVFNVKDYNKIHLDNKKTEVLNWIMKPNQKVKLFDDNIPGYYFLAEVEDAPSFAELRFNGNITITFTANSHKISELEEGNDIWDSFNFLLDYAQMTEFNVFGTTDVTLYNPGTKISYPIINATAPMEIAKNGVVYGIPSGESQSLDFSLSPGENKIKIIGAGTISFHFRKELI